MSSKEEIETVSAPGKQAEAGGLLAEPEKSKEGDDFDNQLEQTLRETEEAVLELTSQAHSPDQAASWQRSRELVEKFRPVPWFIWRLSNFVGCRL